MLGLSLRSEFQERRINGTAIELTNEAKTGATQLSPQAFLEITYPTADVLNAVEAIGPGHGRPVVLIGERGQGKSHLLGVLYHTLNTPDVMQTWLANWSHRMGNAKMKDIALRPPMHIIQAALHRQGHKHLWELLFDKHPQGQYIRDKWEGMRTDVPGYDLLLELFKQQPTALILDEFQTWYEGLKNSDQAPAKSWAFNFIQLLSEIATEQPELLVLVVSVRHGDNEAFRQIHRMNPTLVDFKGPNARRDRQHLLLHRMFQNRLQIPESDIAALIKVHEDEYVRLLDVAATDRAEVSADFLGAWPFAPNLLHLLEDQVLVATHAQETRDLINILADLYKRRGEKTPILTAADFRIDDDESGINALLDSVANQHHAALREKAMRNLDAVAAAVGQANVQQEVPHLSELIGSIWLRSLAVDNLAGADATHLQIDVTRQQIVDPNRFQIELNTLIDNSFNLHQVANRYVFREDENAQAKLMSHARNDRLFEDGSDMERLRQEIRYVLGGADAFAPMWRVIVLPRLWRNTPWDALETSEQPDGWDERIPLIVVPEALTAIDTVLGRWLKENLQKRRNAVRFLMPKEGQKPVYGDRDLLVLARAVLLADKWKSDSSDYKKLHSKYERELRKQIESMFDRFGVLETWNYQNPARCKFVISAHNAQGAKIPEAINTFIIHSIFVPEDFEQFVLESARERESLGKLLRDLQEPRPNEEPCVPWLGETEVKRRVSRMCARGQIGISGKGLVLQRAHGDSESDTFNRICKQLPTGRLLEGMYLQLPQPVAITDGIGTKPEPVNQIVMPFTEGSSNQYVAILPKSPVGMFSAPTRFVEHNSAATSSLNLLAKVKDTWQIGTGTQVQNLVIKIDTLTGAQVEDLLKKLPDGLQYQLALVKEEL